jgi:hypothetical protein
MTPMAHEIATEDPAISAPRGGRISGPARVIAALVATGAVLRLIALNVSDLSFSGSYRLESEGPHYSGIPLLIPVLGALAACAGVVRRSTAVTTLGTVLALLPYALVALVNYILSHCNCI